MQTTLTQYRQRVSAVTGLKNSGDELTLIDAWVNEGVEQFALRTRARVRTATMALTAGTADYTLPTEILEILDLHNTTSSLSYLMRRITLAEMVSWRRATGAAPTRFYTTEGGNLLQLYPTPAAGESLSVVYVPRPSTLVGGTDSPTDIPYEFHHAVTDYACWRGANYDNQEASEHGLAYLAMFDRAVRDCRAQNLRKGGRLAPATVGRPRLVPSDPSQVVRW